MKDTLHNLANELRALERLRAELRVTINAIRAHNGRAGATASALVEANAALRRTIERQTEVEERVLAWVKEAA